MGDEDDRDRRPDRSVPRATGPTGPVDLFVALDGRHDLSGQIYRQVRAAIAEGRVHADEALPSTRDMAIRLSISRGTVAAAYRRLTAEGFLRSRAGAGSYVSGPARTRRSGRHADSPLRPRAIWDAVSVPQDMSKIAAEYDFRSGIPDVSVFPYATWRAMVTAQLRPRAVGTGTHISAAGHDGLRAAIAHHIGASRAIRTEPGDVHITNGCQQAVDLIGRVLLEPGDVVAVEDPGYLPVHRAFTALGAQVVGVPVDDEGLIVDALPDTARLVYVTPSHQYPLGMTMSLPRRRALLDWAERAGAAVIEDDYDGEFRHAGAPLETLRSLDGSGRVLYVGSFSKVLLPTLRLGFLIVPKPLQEACLKAKHVADWHTEVPLQAAAAEFIETGALARHIRRMRNIYSVRHHVVRAALSAELGEHLVPLPSAAGMHLSALLCDPGIDDVALCRRALAAGVATHPLSWFYRGDQRPRSGLVLGYGAVTNDRVGEGLRRMRTCIAGHRNARPA